MCGSKLTAAIPKAKHCPCGSSSNVTNGTPTLVKAETSDNAPLSPTRNASFRVQKAPPKPGRKQSIDMTALQRMNPVSLNLINPNQFFQPSPEGAMGQVDLGPSPEWANYQQPPPNQFPLYPTMTPINGSMNSLSLAPNNGMANVPSTPSSSNGISGHSSVSSSTMTPGTSSSPRHTPSSSVEDFSIQEPALEGTGSCCSRPVQQQPQIQPPPQIPFPVQPQSSQGAFDTTGYMTQIPVGNGTMGAPMPPPQSYGMNNFHQPEIRFDLASFGTHNQPLQQSQWQQFVASDPSFYADHDCRCGPQCTCLGCLAHPFNETTLQYIRDTLDYQNNSVNGKVDGSNPMADPPLAGGETSPPLGQSPAESESMNGEDSNLSGDQFVFVDYHMYQDSCACGDNCTCVNCLIHRGPRSETPN
ncbi:hypothetical protein F4819DRAFT_441795 [Hypoxylon fuscum]|nr:hypothetical protein F4819DRAFT_441795 [Hypoxylon fuscum]